MAERGPPRRSARIQQRNRQGIESDDESALPSTSAAARARDLASSSQTVRGNSIVSEVGRPDNATGNLAPRRGRPAGRQGRRNLIVRRQQRASERAAVVARGRLRSAAVQKRQNAAAVEPIAGRLRSAARKRELAADRHSSEEDYSDGEEWSSADEDDGDNQEIQYAAQRPANLTQLLPDERRGRNLQFLNAGHKLLRFKNLNVSILRTAEQHSREFNAAEAQFQIRFRETGTSRDTLSWQDTHHVLAESLTVALRWLAEEYAAEGGDMWARIQIHENAGREVLPNIDQSYFQSGIFKLTSYPGLVRQTLNYVERISQSEHSIRLHNGLLVYIGLLSTSQVERIEQRANELSRKRKAANRNKIYKSGPTTVPTFRNWTNRRGGGRGRGRRRGGGSGRRRGQLAGGGGSTQVPRSVFGYFTSLNYFKIPREIEALQSYCLPAALVINYLLCQKRRAAYLRKIGSIVPRVCKLDELKYKRILKGLTTGCFKRGGCRPPQNSVLQERRMRLAVKTILREVRRFLRQGHFSSVGPYAVESMLEYASEYFHANILVYTSQGNFLKYTFPPRDVIIQNNLLFKRRQFVLYEEHASLYSDSDVAHMGVVTNRQFFKDTGYHCLRCNTRVITAHSHKKHICRKVSWLEQCAACRRIQLDGTDDEAAHMIYYVDSANVSDYCMPDLQTNETSQCPYCLTVCRSKHCLRLHKSKCQMYTRCDKCGGTVKVKHKDKQQSLEDHVCYETMCKVCWEKYDSRSEKPHMCTLTSNRNFTYWPRYAFWDIECKFNTSVAGCEKCALLESEYLLREGLCLTRVQLGKILDPAVLASLRCNVHKELSEREDTDIQSSHTPIVIVLYYENHDRETFSRICFANPEMGLDVDCVVDSDVVTERYIPPEMRDQKEVLKRTKLSDKRKKVDRLHGDDDEEIKQRRHERQMAKDSAVARSIFATPVGERIGYTGFTTLEDLKQSGLSAISKFLLFTARHYFASYCFIACNSRGYDAQFLLETMLRFGVNPKIIASGRKLLNVAIPALDINYTCSLNFLAEGIDKMAKRFGLEMRKYDFPINCLGNIERYKHYKGPLPPDDMYLTFKDSQERMNEKVRHLAELREEGKVFDFDYEIVHYCSLDTLILLQSVIRFTSQSFDFQRILINKFKKPVPAGKLEFVPPFGLYVTISSYAYDLYKRFGVPEGVTIYALESETGCRIESSYGEMEVALFMEHLYPESMVHSQYTSARPMKMGRYTPDVLIVHPDGTIMCVEYHGCRLKMHRKESGECPLMEGHIYDGNTPNYLGKTGNEFVRERETRDKVLTRDFGVGSIWHLWECEWLRIKTVDIDLLSEDEGDDIELAMKVRRFFDNTASVIRRPKERLVPRLAMRGGRTENFMLHVDMSVHPEYKMEYIDQISLYPSLVLVESMPCGELKILIGQNDLSRLTFTTESDTFGLYYKDPEMNNTLRQVHGLIQCTILPPRGGTTDFPCLPLTINDKSLYVLCYACAIVSSQKPCTHSDMERALTSTWTIPEIVYAVHENNYTVLAIFEVYCYFEAVPLFRDFVSVIASMKMRCDGFPHAIEGNPEAEEAYVRELNEAMGFTQEGVVLTRDVMKRNEGTRLYTKTLGNSFLGKSAQKMERVEQRFMMSQSEFDKFMFKDQSELLSWNLLSPDILFLRSKKKGEYERPNRVANVAVVSIDNLCSKPSYV